MGAPSVKVLSSTQGCPEAPQSCPHHTPAQGLHRAGLTTGDSGHSLAGKPTGDPSLQEVGLSKTGAKPWTSYLREATWGLLSLRLSFRTIHRDLQHRRGWGGKSRLGAQAQGAPRLPLGLRFPINFAEQVVPTIPHPPGAPGCWGLVLNADLSSPICPGISSASSQPGSSPASANHWPRTTAQRNTGPHAVFMAHPTGHSSTDKDTEAGPHLDWPEKAASPPTRAPLTLAEPV